MDVMARIYQEAKKKPIKLCLPEGYDERIVAAGARALDEGYAREVILMAENRADAEAAVEKAGVDLNRFTFVIPTEDDGFEAGVKEYCKIREKKGLTEEQSRQALTWPIYYAAMMLRRGECDGVVCGAATSSGEVVRASLHMVGLKPGINTLSTFFIMAFPNSDFGNEGVFMFSDCAILIDPTPEQLADTAIATAQSYRTFIGGEPIVAMLSFSTKGSASHDMVDEVTAATALVKEREPDLLVDGELQFDAAVVPSVGERKAPDSPVAGKANVLVFPGLEAANIGYKIAQRMAGARAIGPVSQGLNKPFNDLSRGCSVQDVVDVICFTNLQANAG